MKTSEHSAGNYFKECDPLIEKSFTHEQKKEVKRLLKRSISHEGLKVNFTFWFIKFFYITFFFASERRTLRRRFHEMNINEIILMLLTSVFTLLGFFALVSAIFLALYYLKSITGIDIFELHLKDMLQG